MVLVSIELNPLSDPNQPGCCGSETLLKVDEAIWFIFRLSDCEDDKVICLNALSFNKLYFWEISDGIFIEKNKFSRMFSKLRIIDRSSFGSVLPEGFPP